MITPPGTPLLALDAVALDTETTGLDTRKARVVQIAAVALSGGCVAAKTYESLVDPGCPVPPAATAIHGLGNADLAGAPAFTELADSLESFIGGRVVIGHNIGFDLAVLRAEYRRAGRPWTERRALDVRLLAQLVEPHLSDHSIEGLASWLGTELKDRHTAPGDARATAQIFVALIPWLRKRYIRTLAEAEAACAELPDLLDSHLRAGWVPPERREEALLSARALARIDAYPYRHRIREVMSEPPIVVSHDATMKAVLGLMTERRVSSVFVNNAASARASDCGIVTERDFMRALATNGQDMLAAPVAAFMQTPLETVPADAFLYLAIGRMSRLKIRHLGVIDETGLLVGALSQRDLLRLRAGEAVELGDEISAARNEIELGEAWSRRAAMAGALLSEGVGGVDVAAVLSRSLCALTRRAAQLAEQRLAEAERGGPPTDYAMLVMGSGGREESLLAPDQDNAIVHADVPESEAAAVDAWFAELGREVADLLDAAGIPYCRGGVMASNAPWRGSLSAWKNRVDQWLRCQRPEDLLDTDIFFDMRAVYGEAALAGELWRYACEKAGHATAFLKLLAELGRFDPPLGFFGGFRTENGRLDLKMGGLFPIVANVRVLSIRHQVLERSTRERIAGLSGLGLGGDEDFVRLLEIHAFLTRLILDQQLRDIGAGIAPSNRVQLSRLSRSETAELKSALRALGRLDHLVRDLLFETSP